MSASSMPMRWPDSWKDASMLGLLRGASIDCLLMSGKSDLAKVRSEAEAAGLHVVDPDVPSAGVRIVKGEWPGVKMGRNDGGQAGPTGVPWVDSNGWAVRLARALEPEKQIWVDAPPAADRVITASSYLVAMADSASSGGRWIISLDQSLAAALAAGKPEAQTPWKRLLQTAAYFGARGTWAGFRPMAVVGVVSDFAGQNEFFNRELLNLLARTGQQYQILPKARFAESAASPDLRAVIYADTEPPAGKVLQRLQDFARRGGMLITHHRSLPVQKQNPSPVERFSLFAAGSGSVALAKAPPDDPYLWANDSVVLVSHRYDLVRFWNSGATGAYCTVAPDGKQALVHLMFYSDRGPDAASVRIAGKYRAVRVSTVDSAQLAGVKVETQKDAVELHLPQLSQYVAVELETA